MSWPQNVSKEDLEISWYSGTGAGGQHRNKHANCCRMTHRPTGTRSTGQSHRERPANQRQAFRNLARRLVPLMRGAIAGERAVPAPLERVRTYNVPARRVTDHRVPGRVFPLRRTLDGDLDPIHREVSSA